MFSHIWAALKHHLYLLRDGEGASERRLGQNVLAESRCHSLNLSFEPKPLESLSLVLLSAWSYGGCLLVSQS